MLQTLKKTDPREVSDQSVPSRRDSGRLGGLGAVGNSGGVGDGGQAKSFERSVEQYSLRIFALEADLQDMGHSGLVNESQQRKRYDQLQFLTDKLDDIREHWRRKSDGYASYDGSLLPDPSICTPTETKICDDVLLKKLTMFKRLAADSRLVAQWVIRVVSGKGLGIFGNFHLSTLRKKIQTLDADSQTIDHDYKKYVTLVKELESVGEAKSRSMHLPQDMLRDVFSRIDEQSKRISGLRRVVHKEQQRTSWMKRWLNFQELRMKGYFPRHQSPDPIKTRILSKEILGSIFLSERFSEEDDTSLATSKSRRFGRAGISERKSERKIDAGESSYLGDPLSSSWSETSTSHVRSSPTLNSGASTDRFALKEKRKNIAAARERNGDHKYHQFQSGAYANDGPCPLLDDQHKNEENGGERPSVVIHQNGLVEQGSTESELHQGERSQAEHNWNAKNDNHVRSPSEKDIEEEFIRRASSINSSKYGKRYRISVGRSKII